MKISLNAKPLIEWLEGMFERAAKDHGPSPEKVSLLAS
jgi:hypothetical protein